MKQQPSGAVSVYVYEVEESVQTIEGAESQAAERYCAWCGDPPDAYGSHGICPVHASQLIAQASTRRSRKRGRA